MAQLYKQRGIIDRTPVAPDTSEMVRFAKERQAGLKQVGESIDVLQKQHEYAEKQELELRKTHMTEQVNLGLSAAKQSYEIYKDNPIKFRKTLEEGLEEIGQTFEDSESRVKFLARVGLQSDILAARVDTNYKNKQNKKSNDAKSREAGIILDNVLENIGTFNQKTEQELAVSMGQLSIIRDQTDENGDYSLSETERGKIDDVIINSRYYSDLAVSKEMRAAGKEKQLQERYDYLLDNRKELVKDGGYTHEQYVSLLESAKPKRDANKPDPAYMEQANVGLGIKIKDLQLGLVEGRYISKKKGVEMSELMDTIISVEDAYKQKLITIPFYTKNITNLKAAYYEMDKKKNLSEKKGWRGHKDTAGTRMLETVDRITEGLPEMGGNLRSTQFDLTQAFYKALIDSAIDLDDTNEINIVKANTIIKQKTPNIFRSLYRSANAFTDEQLNDPATQLAIMNSNISEIVSENLAAKLNPIADNVEKLLKNYKKGTN